MSREKSSNGQLILGSLDILERLKSELRLKNDLRLARRLGIPMPTLANWKKRGRIPAGGVARIAVAIGRSVEWVRTGLPSALEIATDTAKAVEAAGSPESSVGAAFRVTSFAGAMEDLLGDAKAVDLLIEVARYIKDAKREDRDTIRRLLEGLQAGSDVRTHLIGQLRLIDKLVQAEKGAAPDEAEDSPPRAKAS